MKSVTVTILTLLMLIIILFSPVPAHAQIIYGAKVVSPTSGCATATQATGNVTYVTVNNLGEICNVPAATANSSGLVVSETVTTGSSATAVNIDTAPGQIYAALADDVGGTAGAVVWVNFFNAVTGSVTPGTTAALFSIPVVAQAATSSTDGVKTIMPFGSTIGIPFGTALSWNCTTTKNGATGVTAACHLIVLRK